MNQDRLRVHYETLYQIVRSRYNGLSRSTIEKVLLLIEDADFRIEFETNPEKNKNSKTDDIKKKDYLHTEVGRALTVLSKQPKLDDDEVQDFDIDNFDEEDFPDKLEKKDYCNYPHTLVIAIKETLRNGKTRSNNSAYRLNRNIKFPTPYNGDLRIASRFLYTLYNTENKHVVNSNMVAYIKSNK